MATPRKSWRSGLGVAALACWLAGVLLVVWALTPAASEPPPQPDPPSTVASPAAVPAGEFATAGPVLPRSVPTRVDVPAIGVHSPLLRLGLNPDQTVQVPPLERDSRAGWFDESPTPGQMGPSVLLGHVDSAEFGPGVFFRLGALRPGQQVEVTRSDATVAVFVVDRVESYRKDSFPTLEVYGNTPNAQLRLITCGGAFDHAARSYENNIVAYAHLVSSRPA